jgi:hypothetical protein
MKFLELIGPAENIGPHRQLNNNDPVVGAETTRPIAAVLAAGVPPQSSRS